MSAEELAANIKEHNPVDRLTSLVKAKVPVFHIHGDSDTVVPLPDNSGQLAKRYKAEKGNIVLKVIKGRGHDMWPGWFHSQELVDFIITRARQQN
jgi:predicted esterase